jgi:hypothetical protein
MSKSWPSISRFLMSFSLFALIVPANIASAQNGFGTTYVASVDSQNILSNFDIGEHEISRDGTKVAYTSVNNGGSPVRIFVKNLQTGTLTLASVRSDGSDPGWQWTSGEPSISDDGNIVSFVSYNLDINHPGGGVFVHDLSSGSTRLATIGFDGQAPNSPINNPSISGDGRFIVASSYASNLINQSEMDYCRHSSSGICGYNIYLFDTETGIATRVTSNANGNPIGNTEGAQQPRISQNGRFVIYYFQPGGLIQEWDRLTGETRNVCATVTGGVGCGGGYDVANDGTVYFSTVIDVPLTYRVNAKGWADSSATILERSDGTEIAGFFPRVTYNNAFLAYEGFEPEGGTTVRELNLLNGSDREVSIDSLGNSGNSPTGGNAELPTVSSDGTKVAFIANTGNLVPGVTGQSLLQLYIHDSNDIAQPPTPIVDRTPPQIGTLSWSANPLVQGQNTTLSVPVSDAVAGVARVEYYNADADPGLGNGTPMTQSGGVWSASFGAGLVASTFNIGVRALDNAGSWSLGVTDVLAVYAAANGYVTGHAKVLPTSNDTLSIALDVSNNPAKIVMGFTNVTSPASGSFDLDYVVRNNKDEFRLSSTGINWVVVQDSTHASLLGHADMTIYVGGVKTVTQNMTVRFDIVIGTGGSADQVTVRIFNSGDNPSTATAAYVVSELVEPNGSNLMIHP